MYQLILIRYGEIGLKGKNRREFEDKLIRNIKKSLHRSGIEGSEVYKTHGRIYVKAKHSLTQIVEILSKVAGIVSFSPCIQLPLDMDIVKETALRDLTEGDREGTFKVAVKRANKQFPHQTYEICNIIGSHVLNNTDKWKVDVKDPDATIRVEVRENDIYLFSKVIPGLGGMPVGSNGKALLLLSGGIDSPVAGYMTMKRGVGIEAIHFHSFPFTSERAKEKVIDLCKILTSYGSSIKLHIVPFTIIQKEIRQHCPEDLSITVMRRMMVRIAERIAIKRRALALVTGESIGQVASQTLESMFTIENVVKIPIFRPLIATDKTEVIKIAQHIGTYETSILPYEDCCTIFLPKKPKTKPRTIQAEAAEQSLDIDKLIAEAIAGIETIELGNE